VQRLFSMFPSGWAGVALVLLRGSVVASLVIDGAVSNAPPWTLCAIFIVAVSLAAGFLTPYCSSLFSAFELLVCLRGSERLDVHALISAVDGVALAMLGPGAYSLDARLFGRRLITPPRVD
jgi:hypothetical protein